MREAGLRSSTWEMLKLNRKAKRETYLPGDIGLPAPPGLTQMLQDGSGFVLFDSFWHHVQNVMHNGCPQLQVKVRLHTLLRDSLCYTL